MCTNRNLNHQSHPWQAPKPIISIFCFSRFWRSSAYGTRKQGWVETAHGSRWLLFSFCADSLLPVVESRMLPQGTEPVLGKMKSFRRCLEAGGWEQSGPVMHASTDNPHLCLPRKACIKIAWLSNNLKIGLGVCVRVLIEAEPPGRSLLQWGCVCISDHISMEGSMARRSLIHSLTQSLSNLEQKQSSQPLWAGNRIKGKILFPPGIQ